MATYQCDNCQKQFDSSKRKEYQCSKCGSSICAVCVKEVKIDDPFTSLWVNKFCPVCNEDNTFRW